MINLDTTTALPKSRCCECGYESDHASGPGAPTPGDASLCIDCGSLSFFADDMTLRAPTRDEMLAAAVDSELQRLRRIILQAKASREDAA